MMRKNCNRRAIEPLRCLHLLLGLIGLGLLAKLAWVLAASSAVVTPPVVFDRAEHCVESPDVIAAGPDRLARALRRPSAATPACWYPVVLPRYGVDAATATPAPGAFGRAWFRVHYTVPARWPDGEDLQVYVPRVMGDAWQARVNGVVQGDDLRDWRMTWNRPLSLRIDSARLRPGQVLDIEIGMTYLPASGHAMSRITVGPAGVVGEQLAWREFMQFTMPLACGAVQIMLGAFFFAFWAVRRDETAHLLLALASVAWSICNLQYVLPRQDASILEGWYDGILNVSVTWFMWLVYLFALRLDTRRVRWLEWTLPIFVLTMSLLCMPVWGFAIEAQASMVFQTVNSLVAAALTLWLCVLSLRGGSVELRVVSAALLIAVVSGAHDIALLDQSVNPEGIYLLPCSGLMVFGTFLFAVQRRYVHAIDEHEALSTSLARRLAEREAELTANHDRLREFERAQTLATERQRLMRDMHDGLGSTLISSLAVAERGEVRHEVLAGMLRDCVDDLRSVIDSLEPVNHDLVTLLATLRFRLGRRLEDAGLKLGWCLQELPALDWMGPPETLQVMRIVQEALANVVKHARARSVSMSAAPIGDEVEVCIVDDGLGFDMSCHVAGRGLHQLAQRSRALGGTLVVESRRGHGSTVRLRLPIFKRR